MLIRRKQHRIPGLNTTSTADISFMLLIFFLVTTSMNIDKGLRRQLPPQQTDKIQQETVVDKHRLLEWKITADNHLLLNGEPFNMGAVKQKTEDFLLKLGKQHLISVSANPQASYETYFRLQHDLMAAYKSVRNKWALQQYGRTWNACSQTQREVITSLCPQRIIETYQLTEKGTAQ